MTAVTVSTKHFIRTVTMDRPDSLNSFNADMMDELCHAFLDAASDDSVRVLVLTGAGRAFSAGADLKSMGSPLDPSKKDLWEMLHSIIEFPKPFITAANGLGVGIGMTIHGIADMVFMAESARFRAPFSSLGLTAEAASTYTFSRLMGHQKASWALLSGEWFTAKECLDMGLALEVIPDDKLMEVVYEKAGKLAGLPLASLMQTKKLMVSPHIDAMNAAVYDEAVGLANLAGGPANKEAITAFLEKRAPDFSNI
ncbi:MAG: enoyl-CoA hydratase/isomerase family protein [Candidatus Azotimanducaceae bacterium WSBS_2022_MAG_OTU7]